MRIHMKLTGEDRYSTEILGAKAIWLDKGMPQQPSALILYGNFPFNDRFYHKYVIKFRTNIGMSLCKKLEKEGMADLATDFVRGFVTEEYYEDDEDESI